MTKSTKPATMTLQQCGHLGGTARAARLTPKQRSESARNAAFARWSGTPEERKIERAKGRAGAAA